MAKKKRRGTDKYNFPDYWTAKQKREWKKRAESPEERAKFQRLAEDVQESIRQITNTYAPPLTQFDLSEVYAPQAEGLLDDGITWTRPMSKKEAARYLGCPVSKKTQWLNQCIADGTVLIKTMTRTSHCFNLDAFPAEIRDSLRQ